MVAGNLVKTKCELRFEVGMLRVRAGVAVAVHGWAGRRCRTQRDVRMHGLSRCAFMQAHRSRLASLQHVLAHASTVQTTRRWCAGCSMLQQHVCSSIPDDRLTHWQAGHERACSESSIPPHCAMLTASFHWPTSTWSQLFKQDSNCCGALRSRMCGLQAS